MKEKIKVKILDQFKSKDQKIIKTVTSLIVDGGLDLHQLHFYSCFDEIFEFMCEQLNYHIANSNGYIYVCQLGDRDVFKVGLTRLLPEDRVKQLNNESTIEELRLIKFWKVLDVFTFESYIHRTLKKKFPKKKEFFFGNLIEITEIIESSIRTLLQQYKPFERDTAVLEFKF